MKLINHRYFNRGENLYDVVLPSKNTTVIEFAKNASSIHKDKQFMIEVVTEMDASSSCFDYVGVKQQLLSEIIYVNFSDITQVKNKSILDYIVKRASMTDCWGNISFCVYV